MKLNKSTFDLVFNNAIAAIDDFLIALLEYSIASSSKLCKVLRSYKVAIF